MRITWHRFAHFLLDSSPRTLFARQILKIIFACADVESARAVEAKLNACARACVVARRHRRDSVVAKSPYFIELFTLPKICRRDALRVARVRRRVVRARR
jgi:hypothetical protein